MTTDPRQRGRGAQAHEQLPIALFDGVALAVRAEDGRIYVSLRDLCDAIGVQPSPQRRRILADESLHLEQFRVQTGGQFRTIDCLLLEDVPVWLLGIQQRRVDEEAHLRFSYVKTYLVRSVQRAFAELTGLPDAPSSTIEDLSDLDRINQAFMHLADIAQRQETTEISLNRARDAFRDLRSLLSEIHERVQALESYVRAPLSPTQRGTVYHMVQAWGTARAEQNPKLKPGVAIRTSWAELNTAFGVATYTQLPSARYNEIITFIKDRYRMLTGRELEAIEQQALEDTDEQ